MQSPVHGGLVRESRHERSAPMHETLRCESCGWLTGLLGEWPLRSVLSHGGGDAARASQDAERRARHLLGVAAVHGGEVGTSGVPQLRNFSMRALRSVSGAPGTWPLRKVLKPPVAECKPDRAPVLDASGAECVNLLEVVVVDNAGTNR